MEIELLLEAVRQSDSLSPQEKTFLTKNIENLSKVFEQRFGKKPCI
jgi:hypothetical protein